MQKDEALNEDLADVPSTALLDSQFRCDKCGEVFDKGWSDEEALAESEENGWGGIPKEEMACICDDCYREMVGTVPPEEFNAKVEEVAQAILNKVADAWFNQLMYGESNPAVTVPPLVADKVDELVGRPNDLSETKTGD